MISYRPGRPPKTPGRGAPLPYEVTECCPVTGSSRILSEADRPGVAALVVVRDPPDLSDLATVVGVLAGEPVEALRVGEILHEQRRPDGEALTVRPGYWLMSSSSSPADQWPAAPGQAAR